MSVFYNWNTFPNVISLESIVQINWKKKMDRLTERERENEWNRAQSSSSSWNCWLVSGNSVYSFRLSLSLSLWASMLTHLRSSFPFFCRSSTQCGIHSVPSGPTWHQCQMFWTLRHRQLHSLEICWQQVCAQNRKPISKMYVKVFLHSRSLGNVW